MAVTSAEIGPLVIAAGGPTAGGDVRMQFFHMAASTTDTDFTLTGVNLSHVFAMIVTIADVTGTATADTEKFEIKQDVDSTKECVIVASNSLPIVRVLGDTGGALIAKNYIVTLIGY